MTLPLPVLACPGYIIKLYGLFTMCKILFYVIGFYSLFLSFSHSLLKTMYLFRKTFEVLACSVVCSLRLGAPQPSLPSTLAGIRRGLLRRQPFAAKQDVRGGRARSLVQEWNVDMSSCVGSVCQAAIF